MHLGDYLYSPVEPLTSIAAEKSTWRLLLTIRSRLTVQMAGHERKHNTRRAEIGDCVSGRLCQWYIYISTVESPQNVCRGSF